MPLKHIPIISVFDLYNECSVGSFTNFDDAYDSAKAVIQEIVESDELFCARQVEIDTTRMPSRVSYAHTDGDTIQYMLIDESTLEVKE